MTFVNIQSSARRLIAATAIQTCQTCALDKAAVGATAQILRSWRQAWRITCPVCRSHMRAIGQGSAPTAEMLYLLSSHWKTRSRGSVCSTTSPSGAFGPGRPPVDLLKLVLIDVIRNQSIPITGSRRQKVLGLIIPGFDRHVAATGTIISPADRPILASVPSSGAARRNRDR